MRVIQGTFFVRVEWGRSPSSGHSLLAFEIGSHKHEVAAPDAIASRSMLSTKYELERFKSNIKNLTLPTLCMPYEHLHFCRWWPLAVAACRGGSRYPRACAVDFGTSASQAFSSTVLSQNGENLFPLFFCFKRDRSVA